MLSVMAYQDASDITVDGSFSSYLVAQNRIAAPSMARARQSAEQSDERLVCVLSKLGLIAEADLVSTLAQYYGCPIVRNEHFPQGAILEDAINPHYLRLHHILPLGVADDGSLALAMVDPGHEEALKAIGLLTGLTVKPHVAALSDMENALARLYRRFPRATNMAADTSLHGLAHHDAERLSDLVSDAPAIKYINSLIVAAVDRVASDIHIEPFENRLRIRLRVDGMLREYATEDLDLAESITARCKVMARMDVSQRRLPQDGRFNFAVKGHEVELRVSTSPTLYGESVVMRILDRDAIRLDFRALGFEKGTEDAFRRLLARPYGIVLVTGPTGSGKTTTLYTALTTLNAAHRKIHTIEDPVEYRLDGINQQAVLPEIGRTFASALRSFLRQDPNIIMVGEIRDAETAHMAVQAALTGHLVLSTLHTNNAATAITRLLDMGVPDYMITSTLEGVMAQRLVRKQCHVCHAGGKNRQSQHSCPVCGNTGYSGRMALTEVMPMTPVLRSMVMEKADAQSLQAAAIKEGMVTLAEKAKRLVQQDVITEEEAMRVVWGGDS